MRKYALIFGILALVLAACRLESNVGLDINEDGSATFTVEFGMDDEFRDLITSSVGASEDDFLDGLFEGFDGDGPIETRSEGDMTYWTVSTEIDDLSTWDGGDAGEGFSNFSYSFDDNGAKLTASVEGQQTDDLGGDFGFDPSQITDDIISANIIIKMPGKVTEHNADEVRDGRLVWKIPLGGSINIVAESSFGGSGSIWIWIILGIVVLVGIIAAVVAILVTRQESEKAVAAAISAHDAQTPPSTTSPVAEAVEEDLPPPPVGSGATGSEATESDASEDVADDETATDES
ncbi:MAG: hypothetical protein R2823_09120 [Acidimicrobiia bacterium]